MCNKFCDDVAQVSYMGIKLININAFTYTFLTNSFVECLIAIRSECNVSASFINSFQIIVTGVMLGLLQSRRKMLNVLRIFRSKQMLSQRANQGG